MNKLRLVVKVEGKENRDIMYDKIQDLMLENGLGICDFNIQVKSFEEYMIAIFDRRDFVSDEDIQFLATDDQINSNKEHFRECWENGTSPYKALTFLSLDEDVNGYSFGQLEPVIHMNTSKYGMLQNEEYFNTTFYHTFIFFIK